MSRGQGSTTVQKQILETPRLVLREMSLADLDFVAVMLADPEVMVDNRLGCYDIRETEG